jgi:hypothetical protein
MRESAGSILKRKAFFLFLLPLFFVFHGYVQNYPVVPPKDAFILLLYYLVIAGIILVVSFLLFRNWRKASLFSFALLAYQFFFGKAQDTLKGIAPHAYFNHYIFIVSVSLLLFILFAVYLKRLANTFIRSMYFLNLAFLLFITVDLFILIPRLSRHNRDAVATDMSLERCADCKSPDIYMIIADAYAGKKELADLFQYDNSPFEDALRQRGFHIVDSTHSNYNFTEFSMASLLQMNYIRGIKGSNSDRDDLGKCVSMIKQNPFISFLKQQGYDIHNYSIFDLQGNPTVTRATFLPLRTKYITSQTFTNRVMRDLGYHLATTLKIPSIIRKYKESDLLNNEKIYALTMKIAKQKTGNPKFIYSHLMMPHHPFYFDSSGKRVPLSKLEDNYYYDKEMRISYLKYCNRQFLQLIDSILKSSTSPPIILFLGDHGFREFREKVDNRYIYMNLVAVLMPGGKYEAFPGGMTNVNILRGLLNQQFGKQLPYLPDSTFFIRE